MEGKLADLILLTHDFLGILLGDLIIEGSYI